jgi:CMP-N-acetylneuraminic acid synthetase
VLLLTDSQEYAEIGKQHGAVVPFLRPAELSTDTSPVVDVLVWLTKELAARGEKPDYMVLLEPTAPGRQSKHIKELVELVAGNGADSGFTVMPVPPGHNAHWQFALDASNKPSIVTGEPVSQIIRRRQELPPLYVRGGSTYIFHTDLLLLEQPTLYGDSVRVLPIDPKYSVDLDTEEDWQEAEKIIPTLN